MRILIIIAIFLGAAMPGAAGQDAQNFLEPGLMPAAMPEGHSNTFWFSGIKVLLSRANNYNYSDSELLDFMPSYAKDLYHNDSPLPWELAEDLLSTLRMSYIDTPEYGYTETDLRHFVEQYGVIWIVSSESISRGVGAGNSLILFGVFENNDCGTLFMVTDPRHGRVGVFKFEQFVPNQVVFDGRILFVQ